MKTASIFRAAVLWVALGSPVLATTYGSVEPIATPDVIDTTILRDQRLEVRAAFADRLLQCGIVDQVIDVLRSNKSVTTINGLNMHFEVGLAALPEPPIPRSSTRCSTTVLTPRRTTM